VRASFGGLHQLNVIARSERARHKTAPHELRPTRKFCPGWIDKYPARLHYEEQQETIMAAEQSPAAGADPQPVPKEETSLANDSASGSQLDEKKLNKIFIGSIDQGTTSTRFIIFNGTGEPVAQHQIEFSQIYQQSGSVSSHFSCRL
jgi:hypothetical protein